MANFPKRDHLKVPTLEVIHVHGIIFTLCSIIVIVGPIVTAIGPIVVAIGPIRITAVRIFVDTLINIIQYLKR